MAAVLSRTPLVLTEADSHLGLANRLLARRARRVCLSFPIPGREGERYLVTGRPVPDGVLRADRAHGPGSGSGSPPMRAACWSWAAARALARSTWPRSRPSPRPTSGDRDFHVIHLTGQRDHDEERRTGCLEPRTPERYTLIDYEPGLGDVLAACDLVLARSGGSIFEVTAAGRPAILVPYPTRPATTREPTPPGWPRAARPR